MANKADIRTMADYILSQNHERDDVKRVLDEYMSEKLNYNQLRKIAQGHIWYIAMKTAYGRGYAGKKVTELLREIH